MVSTAILPAKKAGHPASERRITGLALQDWYALRGKRNFPRRKEFTRRSRPHLEPHLFVLTPDENGHPYRIAAAGDVLATLCDGDPVGRAAGEALPRFLWERAQGLIAAAGLVKKPLADCGSFPERNGSDVLYRSVYMPIADADGGFAGLLGAISFKRAAIAA
jgi:hypothetical protein